MKSENIAAISTPAGRGGVAVIRISGESPLKVAEKMFFPSGKVKAVVDSLSENLALRFLRTKSFLELAGW